MPGVGHKGRGMNQIGIIAGIPVHGLLAGDGHHGGHQGNHPRHRQRLILTRDDGCKAALAHAQAGDQKDGAQHQRGDTFQPLMAVGVVAVGGFLGDFYPKPGNESGQHVRKRVDGVGDHRPRMAHHPGEQLEAGQHRVADDAAQGQFADDGLFVQGAGCGLGLLAVVGCHKRTSCTCSCP